MSAEPLPHWSATVKSSQAPQPLQDPCGILVSLLTLTTVILIALVTGAARAQQPVALRGATGFVYTADEHGNSISAINLATGTVDTVPISISPHNVQITADGARLLVVGNPKTGSEGHGHGKAGHNEATKGQLLIFNPESLASGPIASVTVGGHPAHVVVEPEGRRAFITLAGANAVAVVDLVGQKLTRTIVAGAYPHGMRISPDGREVYVANVKEGSVSVIDTATLSEAARIPVGRSPVQVGFTPDGRRVYVSLRDENRVAVVDTASRAVVERISVGSGPIQVHATPDGRFVYVANQGTEAKPADTVSVIDVATGTVVDTIRTGPGAHGVAVDGAGRYVFVTNIAGGTVTVIDAGLRSVVAAFPVGRGPNGISFRASK